MGPGILIVAVGLGSVAFLLRGKTFSGEPIDPVAPQTPVTPAPSGKNGPQIGQVVGAVAGAIKLAGQGTSGGSNLPSPSTTKGTAAIRAGGVAIAVGGAIQWLRAHSTAGRISGGVQTGTGTGTAIAPGIGTLIGAGIGALAGWISGFNSNDTKFARWDFVQKLGYSHDGNGFDKAIRVDLATIIGQPRAEALWTEAVSRIGRKDTAWNNDWMERVIRAVQGEPVHAYMNDPTKGGTAVI